MGFSHGVEKPHNVGVFGKPKRCARIPFGSVSQDDGFNQREWEVLRKRKKKEEK